MHDMKKECPMAQKRPQKKRRQIARDVPKEEQAAMLARMMKTASTPCKVIIHNVGERTI